MSKKPKLKKDLILEVAQLKERVKELESSTAEKKQTQELFQTDEEKYRVLYENTPLAYQSLDEDGHLIEVNSAWLRILGYKREQVIGKWLGDYLHPDWKSHFEKNFPEFKKRGYINDVQFKIKHGDGHYLDISFEGQIGYTPEGKFKQAHCVFQDITERKQAEEELRESENMYKALYNEAQRFRDALDKVSSYVYIKDIHSCYIYGNQLTLDLFNCSAEELIGCDDTRFFPPDTVKHLLEIDSRVLNGETTTEEIDTFDEKGKSIYYLEVKSPIFAEQKSKKIVGLMGISTDITERVQTEHALRKSEIKYRSLFAQIADPIFIFDKETSLFLDCNQTVLDLYGYTLEELRTMTPHQLHPPEEKLNVDQNIIEEEDSTPHLYTHIAKEGQQFQVEINTSPIDYEGKEAWISIVRDITERVVAAKTLKKQEEFSEKIINTSNAIIVGLDNNHLIKLFNNGAEKITGYKRENVLGKDWFKIFFPPEILDEMHQVWISSWGKPAHSYINPIRIKNGGERIVSWQTTGFYDEDVNDQLLISIGEDITERKQAEEKFKIIFESAPDPYYLTDLKGNFIDGNKAAERITGYPREELIGKSFLTLNLLPKNQILKAAGLLAKNVLGQSTGPDEFTINSKDGGEVEVEIATHPVEIEGNTLVLGIARDITKRVQAEEQIKLQSLALESAANAIVITNALGTIQWANPAFSTLTGYTLEEAIGNNPRILKSDYHDQKFYKNLWGTISSGEVWQGEIINKRADGELYTEEMTIAPLLSDQNEISNYIAIKHDITDRVQAQAEIQQRTQDLTLINIINAAVNSGENLTEILRLLTKEAKRVFNSKNTTVYLCSEDQKYLEMQNLALPPALVKRIEKLIGINLPDIRIPVEEGSITHELLFADGPRLINDPETIQQWMMEFTHAIDISEKSRLGIQKLISKVYKLVDIQSVITIPMRSAGELIGLMDFSRRESFSEEDTKRVAGVVGQVTTAITSLRAEKEKARSRNLLLILSQAAPAVQRASTAEEIYQAIGERVVEIGFDITVFTLGFDKKHLIVSYQSLESDKIRKIEKLTKLSIKNYSFPLKMEGYYHKIITRKETVFSHFDITSIEEILPRVLRPLANKLMNIVDNQQSIVAPLVVGDEVLGLMAFTSPNLSESDMPAITTFTNQAAIALEKTRLFQETEDLAAFNESIVQNMAEGIVVEDVDGMITFVNPEAVKILGYTSEEWVGKHWTEIVPPDQKLIIQKADNRRIRGEADRYELELLNKDKQRVSALVSGSPRFDREGNFAGTVAVFTDITERKRTEEKISRFSRIFEDSLNEIFLFEPDTLKFTQVNSAGQNNLGYTMEELSELTPLDIKPEITAQAFEYLIAPLRENETDRVMFETVHQRKDGSLYHVEVHLQLLRYEDKALFAAIIMDITERYNAEIESKRYIRRLDALLNIDQAIMGSFDLKVTLNIILEHLLAQLAVDAAAVLSYQADLQTLQFTQGRGFQTPALQYTDLRLGEGYAGEVGLRRDHVFIPDLNQVEVKFQKSPLFSQEEFVSYYGIPLLAKGKLVGVLEIFNRSALDPGDEWVNYLRLLAGQVAIAIDNISLFNDLQRSNVDLTLAYDATIEGWAHALELKDMETEGHSRRVVDMTLAIARRLGISGENLGHIRRGALLHDIGKMGIPDSVLQKPGKLTDDEWHIMKQHPVYAYEWLSRIEYLQPALEIPYAHHEKWDGSGYPRGLEGEQIPLAARIFAIVDVWDALRSDRPYRKVWSKEKTLAHIQEQSEKHFDPRVVDAFVEMISSQ